MSRSRIVNTSLIELVFMLLFIFFLCAAYLSKELAEVRDGFGVMETTLGKKGDQLAYCEREVQKCSNRLDSILAEVEAMRSRVNNAPGYIPCFQQTDGSFTPAFEIKTGFRGYQVRPLPVDAMERQKLGQLPNVGRYDGSEWIHSDEFQEWGRAIQSVLDDTSVARNPFEIRCRLHVRHLWSARLEDSLRAGSTGQAREVAYQTFIKVGHFFHRSDSETYSDVVQW